LIFGDTDEHGVDFDFGGADVVGPGHDRFDPDSAR
jgi:hypothetical protein